MTGTFSSELEDFVRRGVSSGRFRSRDEVLAEGLRLLRERERRLESLRADLRVGLDQLDEGKGILVRDEKVHRRLFSKIQTQSGRRNRKS